MNKAVLIVLVLLLLSPSASAYSAEDKDFVRSEKYGKVTRITIDRKVSRRHASQLVELRQIPVGNQKTLEILIERHNELTPPFLFEIAKRTFPRDRKEAVFWYWMGSTRARLDAILCKDGTAVQGILMLSQMAPEVAAYIKANPKISGEIGHEVLGDPDLMAGTASPWWICLHGAKTIVKQLQGKDPTADPWLKPTEEWDGLFDDFLAKWRDGFDQLLKPTEDPAPLIKLAAAPRIVMDEEQYEDLSWLDDDHLAAVRQAGKFRQDPNLMVMWARRFGLMEISNQVNSKYFCASEGKLYFETGREFPKKGVEGHRKLLYRVGPLGGLENRELEFDGFLANFTGPSSYTYGYDKGGTAEWRLNRTDCEWEKASRLNELFGDANAWAGLGKGRGYVANAKDHDVYGTGLYYFKTLESAPVKIAETKINIGCVKDAPFLEAILLFGSCRAAYIDYRGRPIERFPKAIYFLSFEGGAPRVTERPFALLEGERGMTQALLTKRGLIRLVPRRITAIGKKEAGLYWYREGREPVKIWEGYPGEAEVSPNGCQLAFSFLSRKPGSFGSAVIKKIAILDVCEALPEK